MGRGTEAFVFVTSGAVANGLGFADGGGGSDGGGRWGVFINGEKNLGGCVNERTHLGRVFKLMIESKGKGNGIVTKSMAVSPSTVNFEGGGGAGGGRCICNGAGASGGTN